MKTVRIVVWALTFFVTIIGGCGRYSEPTLEERTLGAQIKSEMINGLRLQSDVSWDGIVLAGFDALRIQACRKVTESGLDIQGRCTWQTIQAALLVQERVAQGTLNRENMLNYALSDAAAILTYNKKLAEGCHLPANVGTEYILLCRYKAEMEVQREQLGLPPGTSPELVMARQQLRESLRK